MTWLVAPPGTKIGEPGWRRLFARETLRWTIDGEYPHLAVQRDGVLICTGLPPEDFLLEASQVGVSHPPATEDFLSDPEDGPFPWWHVPGQCHNGGPDRRKHGPRIVEVWVQAPNGYWFAECAECHERHERHMAAVADFPDLAPLRVVRLGEENGQGPEQDGGKVQGDDVLLGGEQGEHGPAEGQGPDQEVLP
jgi:hypothetical protein